eukprot:6181837-Pleurochrysis_carterae.AAC.1
MIALCKLACTMFHFYMWKFPPRAYFHSICTVSRLGAASGVRDWLNRIHFYEIQGTQVNWFAGPALAA